MKTWRKAFALLAALTLLLSACSGIRGSGVTPIKAVKIADMDFGAGYIATADFSRNDDWRLSQSTLSAKLISGSGAGAWYTGTLPATWLFGTSIDLSGITGAVSAAVIFGADKNTPYVTLKLERGADGKVSFSLDDNGTLRAATNFVAAKDTVFQIAVDSTTTGTWKVYVQGDKKFSYAVQLDNMDNTRLAMFLFSADQPGVVFNNTAVNAHPYYAGMLKDFGVAAMTDLLNNFWNTDKGCFKAQHVMVWDYGMAMLGLEDLYNATGDEQYKTLIEQEWAYMQTRWTDAQITRAGLSPNNWCDDMGWTAMVLMEIYRVTGDQHAIILAGNTVRNAYAYFGKGNPADGLIYSFDSNPSYGGRKSVYQASLILTGLQYCQLVPADTQLYSDTMALYNWTEANLRRDDGLYWCDWDIATGQPIGVNSPANIGNRGGASCLFGNMAMACVNALIYNTTGNTDCLNKAVQTANGLGTNPAYNVGGVLANDRDAWTDAAFAGQFVQYVLPLQGVGNEIKQALKTTAISIYTTCRTPEGYYGPIWSVNSSGKWANATNGTAADQITTTGTSVHMIVAAALAEKLGYIQ
ncbi:MAG: hypothetical protein FWF49_01470 [Oscillospiraceae bacterium]|nr:hypothetical protein [Oscillospiraceae bacterium]